MKTRIVDGKKVTEKSLRAKDYVQCGAAFSGPRTSRGVVTRWCTRNYGHSGDHRGSHAQWNQEGKKVKITLPPDAE